MIHIINDSNLPLIITHQDTTYLDHCTTAVTKYHLQSITTTNSIQSTAMQFKNYAKAANSCDIAFNTSDLCFLAGRRRFIFGVSKLKASIDIVLSLSKC